ncbi:MAG: hypothetical protein HC893_06205 [Chloroflexaceae bacterium]|nr:hypothetical protein [Chloroflexaceae bacterium]
MFRPAPATPIAEVVPTAAPTAPPAPEVVPTPPPTAPAAAVAEGSVATAPAGGKTNNVVWEE